MHGPHKNVTLYTKIHPLRSSTVILSCLIGENSIFFHCTVVRNFFFSALMRKFIVISASHILNRKLKYLLVVCSTTLVPNFSFLTLKWSPQWSLKICLAKYDELGTWLRKACKCPNSSTRLSIKAPTAAPSFERNWYPPRTCSPSPCGTAADTTSNELSK